MKEKIRVLFLQSQIDTWSITDVHSSLIRYYNHERVEVHVAMLHARKVKKLQHIDCSKQFPTCISALRILAQRYFKDQSLISLEACYLPRRQGTTRGSGTWQGRTPLTSRG